MNTQTRSFLSQNSLLLALAAAVGLCLLLVSSPAAAAPAGLSPIAAQKAPDGALPPATCTLDGAIRTCHLWAMPGTLGLPTGENVPIWGFAETGAGPAQLPGPVLIANQNETLQVVLHNQLPGETVSLSFPGQWGLAPDLAGVGTGGVVTYTFSVTRPGTYLYEAGLTANGARQVAMGLYGGLVVRPLTAGQAYDDPATAYDDEALLVLSDMDPAFNNNPYGFKLYNYTPRYWLINGKAYPQTAIIDSGAGRRVLLRYINAGLVSHSMGLLGLQQQVIAANGNPDGWPHDEKGAAEKIPSGGTLDAITVVPASALADTRYPLYDTSLLLHNAGQAAPGGALNFGGMMTFIHAVAGAPPGGLGPVTSGTAVTPSPTTGAGGVVLSANIDDTSTGGQNVNLAEYFVNNLGAPGTGTAISIANPQPQVSVSVAIPEGDLAPWPSGYYIFYVRGMDADGNWGFVSSAVLNLDKAGPEITSLSLWPETTNGTRSVLLRATGDDHGNGRQNVVAGQYSVDGGPVQPMTLNRIDHPIAAMTATLPSATLIGLAEGLHPVAVTAQDSLGNWGVPGVITLTLDKTGPAAPVVTLDPDYLLLAGPPPVTSVRVSAVITDALSNGVQSTLANAEGFIDTVKPDGTGFRLFPSDGLFDEIVEDVYLDISIGNFTRLSQGAHYVYVHGLDSAGNWGAVAAGTIYIDRGATDTTGPTITNVNIMPNPTNGAVSVSLTASAADPGMLSNIAAAEWWIGNGPHQPLEAADGAFDSTVEMLSRTIALGSWRNGAHTLWVRAQDSAFNWGDAVATQLIVSGNNPVIILSDSFESGLGQWTTAVGQVSATPEAAIAPDGGVLGLQAVVDGGAPAHLGYLMPAGETDANASFYFASNATGMGVQPHDILVGLADGAPIFGIQIQAAGGEATALNVRGWVLVSGVPLYTDWHSLADGAHKLGIGWQAGAAASFHLAIDGVVAETLDGLDTADYTLYELWLGPSGGLDPSMSGAEYLDGFELTRAPQAEVIQIFLPMVVRNQ
ncbi:MAG: multicopper oxidase domain-containing protein [Anaerolineae bacterium]|nr:multicopper oxidase domain-containing protein [Anaerolineae bacterium]